MTRKRRHAKPGTSEGCDGFRNEPPLAEQSQSKKHYTLLVVDDDITLRLAYQRFLGRKYESILVVESPLEALEMYAKGGIDLVISDYKMPQMSGAELAKALVQHDPDALVIVVTGSLEAEPGLRGILLAAGACDVLPKPFSLEELENSVERRLDSRKKPR